MPRKKLSREEQLKALLEEEGMDVPELLSKRDEIRQEADSVIEFLQNPRLFETRQCKQCSRSFATSYGSVAMCSDKCRIDWLANIGIEWDPKKSQKERWAGKIPLVVPEPALHLATGL